MKMMHKILLSLIVVASAASAASEVEMDRLLKAKQDTLESKRGLMVDGSITGVLVNSYMNSDQETADSKMPNAERTNFVTADLGFHFRPYDAVRFNAILRLEAGMQNYFASSAKSISVPWMNVEGNIGKNLYWVVGDFRQQYSPLTLFAPTGVDEILYEPLIFSRSRDIAVKNAMIEGNQRNLQGVNLQLRNDFGGVAGEVRAEAIFARLRRVQILDITGANGNLLPNGEMPGAYQSANADKWLLSGNLEYLPLNKNILVGFTGMYVFDDSTSFTKTYRPQEKVYVGEDGVTYEADGTPINKASPTLVSDYQVEPINAFDMDPQKTVILSGRVGADVAGILDNKNLTLDVMGEFAMSKDELYEYSYDAEGMPLLDSRHTSDNEGKAILATLNAGYSVPKSVNVQLSVNYLMNDSNWYNNLAQSPQFFAERILNTDKDGNVSRYGVNAPLYSTFGALYYFDPKFTPAGTQLATTDDPNFLSQTRSYNIAPMTKNSWSNRVYTRKELALMSTMLDPAVQMGLPNGLATPNRNGLKADLKLGYNEFVEVGGLFTMLKQDKSNNPFLKEAEFMEYGGGLKWDVFKMLGFSLPLELSGSYKHSARTQELANEFKDYSTDKGELKMDFINAGFYAQYLPRLGVSAGLQMITMEFDALSSDPAMNPAPGYHVPLVKGKQMQWMAGLDYTIADGVYLALNYGWIVVENTYNTSAGAVGSNMPSYADISITDAEGNVTGTVSEYKHEFSQAVVQAVLNV
ncbi:MAG: hypothetical protein IJ905_00720, partial [Fibrobacter sp.]|nr:hypothetical protein [Fibrobacter sp.]